MIDCTVVVPCYRCSSTIQRALASVFQQTVRPGEVILVDDCSGDNTLDTLYALQQEYPPGWVKVIECRKNGGPGVARNIGWDNAKYAYIAFLDSDDSWHPRKIEIQYQWMQRNPQAALTGHATQLSPRSDKFLTIHAVREEFSLVSRVGLLMSNPFPTPSVMLRRNLPHRFAPDKRYIEDYLLWSEISLDGHKCYYSNLPLAMLFKAEYGEAGLSSNLWAMQKGELDTYHRLYKTGRVGLSIFVATFMLSWLKYFRRVVKVKLKASRG